MKNLTHYFSEPLKPKKPEVTSNVEAVVDAQTGSKKKQQETKMERSRVKIKISLGNSDSATCNLVECNGELVDKTPSPKKELKKTVNSKENVKSDKATAKKSRSGNSRAVKKLEDDDTGKSDVVEKGQNGKDSSSPSTSKDNGETCDVDSNETRSTQDVFQMLMTRNKPIQYSTPPQVSPDEVAALEAKKEETKSKMKQNKEKLINLATKRGYKKRKLAEVEEAEKIEKRIQNRTKMFKLNKKKESPDRMDDVTNEQKRSSGSLHDYFSPLSQEEVQKKQSTLIVQVDVHREDSSQSEKNEETVQSDKETSPEKQEHVEVVELSSQEEETPRRSKRSWSMRIKLPSYNEKSTDAVDESSSDSESIFTPRSKQRGRKHKEKPPRKCLPKEEDSSNQKKSGAPKRKASVKVDKEEEQKTVTREESVDIEIVTEVLVEKNGDIGQKRKPAEKLAPLFTKKSKPDPEVVNARRLFLQSDMKETENRATKQQKPVPGESSMPFPKISHVAQLGTEELRKTDCELALKMLSRTEKKQEFQAADYKTINSTSVCATSTADVEDNREKCNIEQVLVELEKDCESVRSMWQTISSSSNNFPQTKQQTPKRRGRKKASQKLAEQSEKEEGKISQNRIFTEKYRPKCSSDVVGNEEAVRKLKDWLESWRTKPKESESSGDEFYSSDCSESRMDKDQVVVLLGPHGSGKTASVFAIAEEFGYSVLEVNASSRRSGKIMLKDLEEATKSHRVKKGNIDSHFAAVETKVEEKKLPKNSLILLEDVDIVFEEDEGFVSAIAQLTANTKRPIVMTCRNSCSHLSKMAPNQLKIRFQVPTSRRVPALFQLISLAETGHRLPKNSLMNLVQNGDIRSSLLHLQYCLASGYPQTLNNNSHLGRTLWRDTKYSIYKPAIRLSKSSKKKTVDESEKMKILHKVSEDLEDVALISTLVTIDDPVLDFSITNVSLDSHEVNLSLLENTSLHSRSKTLSHDIAEWLNDRTGSRREASDDESWYKDNDQTALKKQVNQGINAVLSQVTQGCLDRNSISVDYLPYVRSICRAEQARSATNSKRGNRFFHYLQGLRVSSASVKPKILDAACKVMQN